MQCRVCGGRMGLTATRCSCGFDSATGDVTAAVGSFRRDRRTAIVTLASGIGNAALLVALLSISTCREALDEARDYRVVVGVPLLLAVAAIYGLGKGLSRLLAIRRRGRILRSMQELPAARVVNR